jgi:hypothetical protein
MRYAHTLTLLPVALLLTACASGPGVGQTALGELRLDRTLPIEPNAATARLQYGRIVARNAVQEQDPFCVFEIDSVSPTAQTVSPGRFEITAVTRSVETLAGMAPLRSTWQVRRVSFGDDDGPTHIYYKTTFRLRDGVQPVRALSCMSNQNASGIPIMRHLTSGEIRAALGDWFTLRLDYR